MTEPAGCSYTGIVVTDKTAAIPPFPGRGAFPQVEYGV